MSGARRLGLLDLALTVGVVFVVAHRTPLGPLTGWIVDAALGGDRPLPSLTATFSHGFSAPPPEALPVVVESAPPADGLPDPWRTALRTTLHVDWSPDLARQLEAHGHPPTPEGAVALVDDRYDGDAEDALLALLLNDALVARARARAASAGVPDPTRYASFRSFLPLEDRERGDRRVGAALALGAALDLGWPIASPHRVTSPFGYRTHPITKARKFHNGIDLGVPVGTEIVAPKDGQIKASAHNAVSGHYLTVDHGRGIETTYCHLDKALVGAGEAVARGDRIALSGNTGRSTGPHLHYIVRIAGEPVDPHRFRRSAP